MDPISGATVWILQQAGGVLFAVAQQYLLQRLGLSSSPSTAVDAKPSLDEYLQKLTARLDEDRIAKLYGAFSKLKDAPKSVAMQGLLVEALDDFHEVGQIPQKGVTGGHPNTELRCMAFVGMAASHNLLHDRPELIAEKIVKAIAADANIARQWLGEDPVREIILRFPWLAPGVTCPKCGFRNSASARFCNQDGYPLTLNQPSGVIVQTFSPVWYIPSIGRVEKILISNMRVRDIGTLIIRDNSLEFQGNKKSVLITQIKHISIEGLMHVYVKVVYGDASAPSIAFFADAGVAGYRGMFGGTKLIADTLQRTYFGR